MFAASPRWCRLVRLFTQTWAGFLWFGPVYMFVIWRFWPWLRLLDDFFDVLGSIAIASAIFAPLTGLVQLFRKPRRALLPFLLFTVDCVLMFSSLSDKLRLEAFADYARPEAAFVSKHCAPVDFIQDSKNYKFGVCGLITYSDGMTDFEYVYDTSGDIEHFDSLSATEQKNYVTMIRRYFKNDPNESFEGYSFQASRYRHDFFEVDFDDIPSDGFIRYFGSPPEKPASPYSPLF